MNFGHLVAMETTRHDTCHSLAITNTFDTTLKLDNKSLIRQLSFTCFSDMPAYASYMFCQHTAQYTLCILWHGHFKPRTTTMPFSITLIFIHHVGTQSSGQTRSKQLSMATGFLFSVAAWSYPFYHCRLSVHACGFSIAFPHFHTIHLTML